MGRRPFYRAPSLDAPEPRVAPVGTDGYAARMSDPVAVPVALSRAVPLYLQTAEFSCGAASLVMALNALRGAPLTRTEEFELWRDATMVGIPGVDQWGLAVAAARRGVPARVVSASEITFPHHDTVVRRRFSEEQVKLTLFIQGENRERARRAGVAWDQRDPTFDDVRIALAEGRVPVLLVDLFTLSAGAYMAPHWVVATEISDTSLAVNDPDPDGPGRRLLSLEDADASLDVSRYQALRTVVLLGP